VAKEFRVKIVAALVVDLRLFNDNLVSLSPRIFADPGHLPAHTLPRHATSDSELSVCNFMGDVKLRCRGSDWRQLVTESLIERLKPIRKHYDSLALGVQDGDPVVNIFHFRRLNERVVQVLVCRVHRMVDTEATARLRKGPNHLDRPLKKARDAGSSSASDGSSRVTLADHSCATVAGAFDPDSAIALALYAMPVIIDPAHTCSQTKKTRHSNCIYHRSNHASRERKVTAIGTGFDCQSCDRRREWKRRPDADVALHDQIILAWVGETVTVRD
jgi:hypothetical protein